MHFIRSNSSSLSNKSRKQIAGLCLIYGNASLQIREHVNVRKFLLERTNIHTKLKHSTFPFPRSLNIRSPLVPRMLSFHLCFNHSPITCVHRSLRSQFAHCAFIVYLALDHSSSSLCFFIVIRNSEVKGSIILNTTKLKK